MNLRLNKSLSGNKADQLIKKRKVRKTLGGPNRWISWSRANAPS